MLEIMGLIVVPGLYIFTKQYICGIVGFDTLNFDFNSTLINLGQSLTISSVLVKAKGSF